MSPSYGAERRKQTLPNFLSKYKNLLMTGYSYSNGRNLVKVLLISSGSNCVGDDAIDNTVISLKLYSVKTLERHLIGEGYINS